MTALGVLVAAALSGASLAADAATYLQLKILEHNVNQAFLQKYLHQHKDKVRAAPGGLRGIGVRIVKATRNAFGHNCRLHVVDIADVNAITSPGGNIFLYKGLIGAGLSDDEIAALLGHEVAHVTQWHWLARLQRNLDAARMAVYTGKRLGRSSAEIAYLQQAMRNLAYDREEEFKADLIGMQLMVEAGFKPEGAVALLKRMKTLQTPNQAKALESPYLATHPGLDDRIARLQAHIDSGQAKPQPKKLLRLRR